MNDRGVTVNKDSVFCAKNPARRLQFINKMLNCETARIMEKDTLVVLAAYNSETEAEIDKTKLESAGIWAMIRNEYMSTFYPTGALPAELVVRSSDLAKARKLLPEQ